MIEKRAFNNLGQFDNEWLSARYHFSFAGYYDPRRMGVGPLRVWNDDTIRAGTGFDMHGHRDMEIITYVRQGAISHRDHLGNAGRTEAGDVQVMSAGKGIMHAEYNLESEDTQIYQIWIEPAVQGIEPRWETKSFPKGEASGKLIALASGRSKDEGALHIYQDAAILGATLHAEQEITHEMGKERQAYLTLARGSINLEDGEESVALTARDGAVLTDLEKIKITATQESEILIADVPAA